MRQLELEINRRHLKELLDYFQGRAFRSERYGGKYLTWDIKVCKSDYSGKTGDYKIDSKWDVLWDKYFDQKDVFDQCCEDGLGFVGDEKSRRYDWHDGIPEIEGCGYELRQIGRSGGHLILTSFNDTEYTDESFNEIHEEYVVDESYICEQAETCQDSETADCERKCIMNKSDEDIDDAILGIAAHIKALTMLKIFCDSLDKFDASSEWNHQCNYRRNEIEYSWESGDFSCFDERTLYKFLEDKSIAMDIKQAIKQYLIGSYKDKIEELEVAA